MGIEGSAFAVVISIKVSFDDLMDSETPELLPAKKTVLSSPPTVESS